MSALLPLVVAAIPWLSSKRLDGDEIARGIGRGPYAAQLDALCALAGSTSWGVSYLDLLADAVEVGDARVPGRTRRASLRMIASAYEMVSIIETHRRDRWLTGMKRTAIPVLCAALALFAMALGHHYLGTILSD